MGHLLKRLGVVSLFAIAMAWVEAAVVVYLRLLIGRVDPYQADPLPITVGLGWIEVGREAATLLMLLAVGWLAGRGWRGRLGFALLAFGVWDISYYLFLVPMSGWPRSLLDWDVLFLIPLPWWGPVLAPVLISLLMICGGVLAGILERMSQPVWPRWWAWLCCLLGIGVALYTFMSEALRLLPEGETAIRQALPVSFNWGLFVPALVLMAVPVLVMGWKQGMRLSKKGR